MSRVVERQTPKETPPADLVSREQIPALLKDLNLKDTKIENNPTHPVLRDLVHLRGSALSMVPGDSPTYGTTTCLGKIDIDLEFGKFQAYGFQTTEFGGKHIIVLAMGDVASTEHDNGILVRLHSECVTSETLRGCDCDCVEQLNGALERIAEEGRGMLIYMRQEGRGAGYSCKSRDRMGVAASNDELHTFELYEAMGLDPDPRSYRFLSDVSYLLGIDAPVRLMTNNPGKIRAIEEAGLKIAEHCPLVIKSNPFNLNYLTSKGESGGHLFSYKEDNSAPYPWDVKTFSPYNIQTTGAQRFTHVASYPLPVKPPDGILMLNAKSLHVLQEIVGLDAPIIVEPFEKLGRFKVAMDKAAVFESLDEDGRLKLAKFLAESPVWFNDHVYHDRISQLDYVALVHESDKDATPIVRIQCESLFQRFPLKQDKLFSYERSVQKILENGSGMVLLYPEDGRGNGFSSLFLERFLVETGAALNIKDAREQLGCREDTRDYRPIAALIKHHYGERPIKIATSRQNSGTLAGLRAHDINIVDHVVLGTDILKENI